MALLYGGLVLLVGVSLLVLALLLLDRAVGNLGIFGTNQGTVTDHRRSTADLLRPEPGARHPGPARRP